MNFRNLAMGSMLCTIFSIPANGQERDRAKILDYRVDTCDVLQVIFVTDSKIVSTTDLLAVQRDGSIAFPFAKLDVRGRSAEEIQVMLDTLKADGKIPEKVTPHIKIVDLRNSFWKIDLLGTRKSK